MSVAAEVKARQSEKITLRGGLKDFALVLLVMVILGAAVFITVQRRVAFINVG